MDQLPTLQQLEYLESGFEVSKILAQAGFLMDKPAFAITWGQIAEEIAHTLADHGLPPDRLRESRAGQGRDSNNGAGVEDFLIDWRKESRKFFRTMMYFSGEVPSVVLQRITRPSQPS